MREGRQKGRTGGFEAPRLEIFQFRDFLNKLHFLPESQRQSKFLQTVPSLRAQRMARAASSQANWEASTASCARREEAKCTNGCVVSRCRDVVILHLRLMLILFSFARLALPAFLPASRGRLSFSPCATLSGRCEERSLALVKTRADRRSRR